jgi:diguanylate cyclase (GGDEF)-like protein
MAVAALVCLEYDVLVFWDDLHAPQRKLRLEEVLGLSLLLGASIFGFVVRRLKEHRREVERVLRGEFEAREARALALQDALTGLPNRRALVAALDAAFAQRPRAGLTHAFFLMDLNGFKSVNDTYGHAAGDEVLRAVAQRFRAVSRACDVVARLGGDEFAVLSCNLEGRKQASEVGQRFIGALANKVMAVSASHTIGVAIGVALFPQEGESGEEIMQRADVAMYAAKAAGVSTLKFHDELQGAPALIERAVG